MKGMMCMMRTPRGKAKTLAGTGSPGPPPALPFLLPSLAMRSQLSQLQLPDPLRLGWASGARSNYLPCLFLAISGLSTALECLFSIQWNGMSPVPGATDLGSGLVSGLN